MAANYAHIMQEIERRLAAVVAKHDDLSEADALSAVFKADPALYRTYREASAEATVGAPRRAHTRAAPALSPVEAEIEARTAALLRKSSGLSQIDALAEVMKDPALYAAYRQQGEAPTPSADVPLPPWQPPDRDLFRYIPGDVQRAVLKAALTLEPTNARRGLQRVCERLTALRQG
jgi:hypothetical protein